MSNVLTILQWLVDNIIWSSDSRWRHDNLNIMYQSVSRVRKDEIAAAIRDHQVVIVAGETGSGRPPSCRRSASSSAAACGA